MSGKQFLLIGVAVLALLGGLLSANVWLTPTQTPLAAGTQLPEARELPDFQLIDQHRQAIGKSNWQGRWTLIFPGFTYCPDICPTTLHFLKKLHAELGPQAAELRMVFLSVDPERDTPERLKTYLQYYGESFSGVSAAEPQLAAIAKALSVIYIKVPGKNPGDYTMDHSSALVLLDPQVRVAAFFTPPFQLDPMAADLKRLLPAP